MEFRINLEQSYTQSLTFTELTEWSFVSIFNNRIRNLHQLPDVFTEYAQNLNL